MRAGGTASPSILTAIDRLEAEGAGNPAKAEQARVEYEAEEAEAAS